MDRAHWIAYLIGLAIGGIGALILFKTSSAPKHGDIFRKPTQETAPKFIALTCLAYLLAIIVLWTIANICDLVFTNLYFNTFIYEFLGVLIGSIVMGEVRYKKVGTLNNSFALIVFVITFFQIALSFDKYQEVLMELLKIGGTALVGIALGVLFFKVYVNKREKR